MYIFRTVLTQHVNIIWHMFSTSKVTLAILVNQINAVFVTPFVFFLSITVNCFLVPPLLPKSGTYLSPALLCPGCQSHHL